MKAPQFTLDDVKYAENAATYRRAQELYDQHKVVAIGETAQGYRAIVQGTHPYQVHLSSRSIDQGECTCYLGQHGRLCKHMLALALAVLNASGKVNETPSTQQASTSLEEARPIVNTGMRKLKPYTGPSRIWFSYQRSLATGAGMITAGVSQLPPTKENARYLWKLITRIDQKLVNGVDDSDGVIGECAMSLVEQLVGYAKKNGELEPLIRRFSNTDTNFDFDQVLRTGLG